MRREKYILIYLRGITELQVPNLETLMIFGLHYDTKGRELLRCENNIDSLYGVYCRVVFLAPDATYASVTHLPTHLIYNFPLFIIYIIKYSTYILSEYILDGLIK